VQFGRPTACEFREEIEAPWFAWWLKDKPTPRQLSAARRLVAKAGGSAGPAPATHAGDDARGLVRDTPPMPEVETFQTGSNQWKQYDSWPPRQAQLRNLYFHDSGRLSFDAPRDLEGFDSYISDPARPVPYRKRPISPTYPGPGWPTWLTEDQRFVHLRPDVLSWQTDSLAQDLVVTGDITARLFASTSGTDSDWVVKLIDVYPENYGDDEMRGYQLIIADEVMRARFRNSFERPEPVPAGKAIEYAIGLHGNDHAFLKGHRIMVQVQSTWFPLIDRNPQKFVPNIFQAVETDFQPATQRIFRSKAQASRVELPVVGP
jgi:putative CocE/NonD family hydrolase